MDVNEAASVLRNSGAVVGGDDLTVTATDSFSQGGYVSKHTVTASFGMCDIQSFTSVIDAVAKASRFPVTDGEVGRR